MAVNCIEIDTSTLQSDTNKAAELLGKRMGLFTEAAADDLPPPTIIDDIRVPPGAPPRTTAGEERRG